MEDFDDITGRTREMIQALSNLNTSGSTLIVTASSDTNVVRSARNIPRVWTMPANLLNAGELLKRSNLVLTLDALRRAEDLWGEGADSVEVLPVGTSSNGHDDAEVDEPEVVEEPVLEETSEPAEAALDEVSADDEPDASDAVAEQEKKEGEA